MYEARSAGRIGCGTSPCFTCSMKRLVRAEDKAKPCRQPSDSEFGMCTTPDRGRAIVTEVIPFGFKPGAAEAASSRRSRGEKKETVIAWTSCELSRFMDE